MTAPGGIARIFLIMDFITVWDFLVENESTT